MISRRNILFGFSALVLTACSTPPPILGEGAAEDFAVTSIRVDASGLSQGVEGRPNNISASQVRRDLSQAFDFVFENRKSGSRQVTLAVSVQKLHLSSRADSALSIVPSHLVAEIRLADARTGALIVPPFTYSGASEYDLSQPVHIVSALTKLSVPKDYLDTVYSYAEQVNEGLFGPEGSRKSVLSNLELAS